MSERSQIHQETEMFPYGIHVAAATDPTGNHLHFEPDPQILNLERVEPLYLETFESRHFDT